MIFRVHGSAGDGGRGGSAGSGFSLAYAKIFNARGGNRLRGTAYWIANRHARDRVVRRVRKNKRRPADRRSCSPLRFSGDSDLPRKINVLDGIEDRDALLHRPLERLPPGDESHAACPFVDNGSPPLVRE